MTNPINMPRSCRLSTRIVRAGWPCALALALVGLLPLSATAQESELTLISFLRKEALALENGEGVERDPVLAAKLYCKAAKLGDAESQYNLGWMYTNGRGVERNDLAAAFFFNAAAEQGLEAAQRMLKNVGGPTSDLPDCMREARSAPAAKSTVTMAALASRAAAPSLRPPVAYQAIAPRGIYEMVTRMAPTYQVEPQLVLAIIQAESNFNSAALSPKNAKGLMQLIPETAERFNVRNAYDPAQNVRGGMSYLRWLLAYFEGDVALVAAAYNAGEGKVERYRGVPPYVETRAYVQKVLRAVGAAVHPFDQTVTRPSPQLALIRSPALGR